VFLSLVFNALVAIQIIRDTLRGGGPITKVSPNDTGSREGSTQMSCVICFAYF
jgi:hypothetical protein